MSSDQQCQFVERRPGEWYIVLEDYHAPKNSWNWLEHAKAHGPFETLQQADDYLRSVGNPGATQAIDHEWFTEMDQTTYGQLFEKAERPVGPGGPFSRPW